jgi:hypothetical protein
LYCLECAAGVNEAKRAILRAQNHEPLEVWPDTYRGKIPVIPGTEQPIIRSEWFKDKDDAKRQLLITAAFVYYEGNAVKNISFTRDTGSSGNYRYTIWRASGVPCQVRK